MRQVLKVLLSVWILYHLLVVLILPNSGSYLGRRWSWILTPYGNVLALHASWNFFSPDPANTMYLTYKVRFSDEQGNENQEPVEGYLPPEKSSVVYDGAERRLLYAMRYLALDSRRVEAVMGPWLCRKFPGASEVSMRHVVERLPSLDVARLHSDRSVNELKGEIQSDAKVVDCRHPGDEIEW